ncbi:MAG: hypothetical protein WA941_18525 [Nitrososphaeraceae archaeon]
MSNGFSGNPNSNQGVVIMAWTKGCEGFYKTDRLIQVNITNAQCMCNYLQGIVLTSARHDVLVTREIIQSTNDHRITGVYG